MRPVGAELSATLPSFRDPPLEEVALAVQFEPDALDYLLTGRLVAELRSTFPRREEQPARRRARGIRAARRETPVQVK